MIEKIQFRYPMSNDHFMKHDTEQLTVLELIGKVTNKMNEVIDIANNITVTSETARQIVEEMQETAYLLQETINQALSNFNLETEQTITEFNTNSQNAITQMISDSTYKINIKVTDLINQMLEDGTFSDMINDEALSTLTQLNQDVTAISNQVALINRKLQGYVTLSDFGVVGDGSDETINIQRAFDYAIENNLELVGDGGKVYGISSPLMLSNTSKGTVWGFKFRGASGSGFTGGYGTTLKWVGNTTSSAMIIMNEVNYIHNTIAQICIDGSSKARYGIQLDSKETSINKSWTFDNIFFTDIVRSAVLIGHDETTTTYDSDIHNNIFNHCVALRTPIFAILNVTENCFQTVFRSCSFESIPLAGMNFIRNLRSHKVILEDCFCCALTSSDATTSVVYSEMGAVNITRLLSEESRVFYNSVYNGFSDNILTIRDVDVNDTNEAKNKYFVYSNAGYDINLQNCRTFTYDTYSRKVKASNVLTVNQVSLGALGNYEVSKPWLTNFDGIRSGSVVAANHNFDFSKWLTENKPIGFSSYTGTGGIQEITKSNENVVIGKHSCKIDVTYPSSSYLSGLMCYLPMAESFKNTGFTVIVKGKLSNPSIQTFTIMSTADQQEGFGATYVDTNADNSFTAYASFLPTSSQGHLPLMMGISASQVGTYWIDTVVVIPYLINDKPSAKAIGYSAMCDEFRQIYHEHTYPTTGTWFVGDYILNSNPYVGAPMGWVCIEGNDTGGSWLPLANITSPTQTTQEEPTTLEAD